MQLFTTLSLVRPSCFPVGPEHPAKKLEESLECALFDRQHKTLSLTEEGKMVLDYAG